METTENERLKKVQETLGYKSQQAFADALGIKQGSLSDVYRAKNGIGVSSSIKIALSNLGIDLDWLRTGKGSMLRTPEATEELAQVTEDKGRPYYDVDFMGGYGEFLDNPSSSPVSYMIDYPPYNKEGVFYMNIRGDSMSPELISGEKVALRLVEDWQSFLFFGKIYGIVTRNGLRTIKRLRKGKDDDHYLLQATNPDYDDQEIPIAQIERVFEVLGSIREYE